MRGQETTITTKGQVTIPVELRAKLGLKPKDKVRFELADGALLLRKAPSRIDQYFGSMRVARVLDWRQEREAFEQGVAEEVMEEG